MRYILTCFFLVCSIVYEAHAVTFDILITKVEFGLEKVLFFKIFHIPAIVLLLFSSALFFTVRFRFINIRLFAHAFSILIGKNKNNSGKGEINHFQAFATAVSGTIGLGTVAGVAVAVSIGGPGAIMWMIVAGFLGMSSKFVEVTLGFKYRGRGDSKSSSFGGPFLYIKEGLADLGFIKLGIILSYIYAVLLIIASVGGAIAFQANQTISIIKGYSDLIDNNIWIFGAVLTLLVALIILGGIKRLAHVTSAMVPIMSCIYVASCLTIIAFNFDNLGLAFKTMLYEMVHGNSALGGFMGAFVAGTRRACFANEAGIGTSPIAHAATKESVDVRAGLVAMLEPCIDTMIICFLTGLVIVVSNVSGSSNEGILITRDAFASVTNWFPIFLSISVPFFAFSTLLSYSYYCEMGWLYLFKSKKSIIYAHMLIMCVIFLSTISHESMNIAKLGDMLFMCLAVPNIIAMFLLNYKVATSLKSYVDSLQKAK